MFVIGANAADTVDADNVVGTEDGVVRKTYDLGDAAAGDLHSGLNLTLTNLVRTEPTYL